jgi:hypothetical protein
MVGAVLYTQSQSTMEEAMKLNNHLSLVSAAILALNLAAAGSAQATVLTSLPGATTTASSCYLGCGNAAYDHSNILDGDFGGTGNTGLNSWNSGGFGGYVQVNFGAAYTLDKIELYGGFPYENLYSLSVSLDGNSWQSIVSGAYHLESGLSQSAVQGGTKYGAVHAVGAGTLAGGIQAQYLRYTLAGGSHWAYLYEVAVEGHGAASPGPVMAVPEPGTYALMLAGMGLMGAIVRRRKQNA